MAKKKKGEVLNGFKRVHTLRYILYAIKASVVNKKRIKKIEMGKFGSFLISDIKSIKASIEHLDNFDGWKNFNMTWDIMWVGLDIRYAQWMIGRHNSPIRQLVNPVKLIKKFKGNVVQQAANQALVQALEIPASVLLEREKMFKNPQAMVELEKEEKITEFLVGDVSNKITKAATKKMLQKQMEALEDDE